MNATASTPVVFFGTTPLSAPWLTEHQLAVSMAKRRPVLFVEPPMSPLTPLRGGQWNELRTIGRPRFDDRSGLHAVRPVAVPPLTSQRAQRASRVLVRSQVLRSVRTISDGRPVAVFAHAAHYGAARESRAVYLLKDLNDSRPELFGLTAEYMRFTFNRAVNGADAVVVISDALQATLRERGVESTVIRHGFNDDVLQGAPRNRSDIFDGVSGPKFVYAGRIDGRLDFTALRRLSDRYSDGRIAMVGPINATAAEQLSELRARDNVTFTGQMTRPAMFDVLAASDCGLLPYVGGEWANNGSPLKLWDYLGAGLPVAATGYTVVKTFGPPLAYFSETDLLTAVSAALKSEPGFRERRVEFATANSWDQRAIELEQVLGINA